MQLGAASRTTQLDEIAARVALRIRGAHPSRAVEWLVHVAYNVEQPDQIKRLQLIRATGREHGTKNADLGSSVRVWYGGKLRSIP